MDNYQDRLKDEFNRLYELIVKERNAAKALNVDEMLALNQEKEELINHLESIPEEPLDGDCLALADKIRKENRRNAYFYLNALQSLRQAIDFFGDKLYFCSYEKNGNISNRKFSGNLLSGRI